jgi:hypothetical protein
MVTQFGMSLLRPRMRAPRLIFTAGYPPLTQGEGSSCNVVFRRKPALSQQTLRIHLGLQCNSARRSKQGCLPGRLTDGHIEPQQGRLAEPSRPSSPGAILGA